MEAERYGAEDNYRPHIPYVLEEWGEYDALDGGLLYDGDELEIAWSDGSVTKDRVEVVDRGPRAGECDGTSEAYVVVEVRGARARIRLVEAGVRSAVRVKPRRGENRSRMAHWE